MESIIGLTVHVVLVAVPFVVLGFVAVKWLPEMLADAVSGREYRWCDVCGVFDRSTAVSAKECEDSWYCSPQCEGKDND